jgi:hypothetical protein
MIRSLHWAATEGLDVLYQHRLLTTSQLGEIVMPGRGARWTQQMFAELTARGLASAIPRYRPWPGPGEKVWFLTERGSGVVEAAPGRAETRRHLVSPEVAAGPFQAHTLAVNDVGIAFLRAARERGHDFWPGSWRHEVAHDLRGGSRQPQDFLVTDAVLRYWTEEPDGGARLRYRFLELDRANVPADALAARLARYARLHRRWTDHWSSADGGQSERMPAWPYLYRVFPAVLVVLANPMRANLRRRLATLIALCRSEPELQRQPEVSISFALLDDLLAWGPFAPIFRRPEDDRAVDWLGREADQT